MFDTHMYQTKLHICSMDLTKTLARNLRKRRGKLSQRDFARKTGVSSGTIARIENEQQNVTLKTLQQLMKAFKCPIEDLFKEIE